MRLPHKFIIIPFVLFFVVPKELHSQASYPSYEWADSMIDVSIKFKRDGKVNDANNLLDQVLNCLNELDSTYSGLYTDTYRQIGFNFRKLQKRDSAVYAFKKSASHFNHKEFPKGIISNLDTYNQIGVQFGMANQIDSANFYFNQTLTKAKEFDDFYNTSVLQAISNLRYSGEVVGDFRSAFKYSVQKLNVLKEMKRDPKELAHTYAEHALTLTNMYGYKNALLYCDTALQISTEIEDIDDQNIVQSKIKSYIGRCYNATEHYEKSINEFESALNFLAQVSDSIKLIRYTYLKPYCLTLMGKSHIKLANYQKALDLFRYAKQLYIEEKRENDILTTDNLIGSTFLAMNRPDDAIDFFEAAYDGYYAQKILKPIKLGIANENMGKFYYELGNTEKAKYFYSIALQEYLKQPESTIASQASIYERLGIISSDHNQWDLAEMHFKKAIQTYPSGTKDFIGSKSRFYSKLAMVYDHKKDFTQYSSVLDSIAKFIQVEEFPAIAASSYPVELLNYYFRKAKFHYSKIHAHEGAEFGPVIEHFNVAKHALSEFRQLNIDDISKLTLIEDYNKIYDYLTDLYFKESSNNHDALWDLIATADENHYSFLTEHVLLSKLSSEDHEISQLLQEKSFLQKEMAHLQKQTRNIGAKRVDIKLMKEIASKVNELSKNKTAIQESLITKSTKYSRSLEKWSSDDYQSWSQSLQDNQLILGYIDSEISPIVYIISNSNFQANLIQEPAQLNKYLIAFTGLISDLGIKNNLDDSREKLDSFVMQISDLLIQPFEEEFANSENLIVIPSGLISSIPFEMLRLNNKPLVQDKNISYAGSIRLLYEQMKMESLSPINVLAVAPTFENDMVSEDSILNGQLALLVRSGQLPLPGAQKEVEDIMQHMNGKVLTGNQTKSQFVALAPDFGILHMSTHTLIDDADPLNSTFLFGQSNGKMSTLSAAELYTMNLSAHLAVLSACNTGSGKSYKGEGPMSLSRSFLAAGVPSTVISLWKVPDASTRTIMKFFYENLSKDLPINVALSQAKRSYLSSTKTNIEKHPFYWAGFIAAGDPGKIEPVGLSPFPDWGFLAIGFLLIISGLSYFQFKRSRNNVA